jgi:two-component system NtrC family sensor kinase
MTRGARTAGRKVKKQPRKAVRPRRPSKTARRSAPSTPAIDDLREQLNEALAHQAATAEVLRLISSSPGELGPVFEAVLEKAVNICGAKFGLLFRWEGDAFRTVAMHGVSQALADERRRNPILHPNPKTGLGRVIETKRAIQVADVRADPGFQTDPARRAGIIGAGGARTLITVPILKDNELVGAIGIYRQEVRPFTDKQIALVENFATQAVIAIENARLLNELRQRTDDLSESLEQQTATSEVLKVISSSTGELEPVFNAMLENATRICGAQLGTLEIWTDGGCRLAASHGVPPAYIEFREREPIVRPGPGHPLSLVAATKQVVHIADALASSNSLRGHLVELAGARTLLIVPMLKDDELVGTINIYRQKVRPFTDKQIELVQNFAAQAVIAIENARLLNELRQRTDDLTESLEQQTATAEVLAVISSSPGKLEPVFNSILANAAHICEANFGNLLLCDGDTFRVALVHSDRPEWSEFRLREPVVRPGQHDPLGRLAATNRLQHVFDLRTEQAYLERFAPLVALVDIAGARTILLVPMLKEEQLMGVIGIYRQEVRPFTAKQIELVQNFAAQAVIAIENTRLLNELRQRTDDLTESLEQQTATSEVLGVISSSPGELEAVFLAMLEHATRICQANFGFLFRYEDEEFRPEAMQNVPDDLAAFVQKRGRFQPRPDSVLDLVLRTKELAYTDDDTAGPSPASPARLGGARSTIAVPMLKDDKLVGAIVIYRQEVRSFSDKQIELVKNFAAQAVIAIENARLLNELRERTDDLSRSLEGLRTTQDRLVQTEKLASLGQLTAGIAHEIKNPLNFVNNFSTVSVELIDELRQALAVANLDDRLRAEIGEIADMLQGNLDKVVQHGRRADSIVKNMLQHSRQGSGEHRPVDINALVEESLNLAYHGARAEKQGFNITLERSLDPTAGEIDVFPQDITRVLLNLVSNGFYAATKRKGDDSGDGYEPTLSAATKNLGDRVEIRIRDNGTGIPPEVRDKMFNPFFTTKPAGEGTGLGLSISHGIIVKQHGGSIEVDTKPGEFAEFRIILPRTAASLAKSGGEREPANSRG